ncbi:MAG: L7Ae/L30e/S12e/Gadd45 family ribosomal protein [Wujia sp.]
MAADSNPNKALSMLSIAAKAGRVVSGGFMTERSIQEGSACLVLIATDASDNTQKKFINKCTYYNVPYRIVSDANTLGRLIGRQNRTTVTVTDSGLAQQILNKINN